MLSVIHSAHNSTAALYKFQLLCIHIVKYKLLCPRGTQTCALAVANIKVTEKRRAGKTRRSADADNRIDAFSGKSRSTNMVPFHM